MRTRGEAEEEVHAWDDDIAFTVGGGRIGWDGLDQELRGEYASEQVPVEDGS
jgi:hypothetical protein